MNKVTRVGLLFLLVATLGGLGGCASIRESLPEAHINFDPALNERAGNVMPLFVRPDDKDVICSAKLPLSKEMRLTLTGFFAKHLVAGERVFIPPGKFIRVVAATNSGEVLMARGVVDDTLSAVFFNLPKQMCDSPVPVQALIVSNAGTSVQTADRKIFGPLYRLVRGPLAPENPTINVGSLVTNKAYLEKFLQVNPSPALMIPGLMELTDTEVSQLDEWAGLAAKEMSEETNGAKFLGNAKFFFDFTDFIAPPNFAIKGAFLAFNTYNALNVPPHGFTELSCQSTERLTQSAQYIRDKAVEWAKNQGFQSDF
ncbi:MAG: hypothetical protein WCG84_04320, partial [Candidatus Moraniibacteriota bacterium]